MISVSKNLYIDKLGYIVNKYINIYYRTIKMKLFGANLSTCLEFNGGKKRLKILNLKLNII